MPARRASPLRPVAARVLAVLFVSATGPACPGFGDRLPPDAAGLDGAAGPRADAFVDAAVDGAVPADLRRLDAEPTDAAPLVPIWAPEMADFFVRHCGLCHGETPVGGAPYALVTYAQVVPHLDAIVRRTVDLRDMPPGGGLVTEAERAALVAWVEAGAPEGPSDAAPPGAAAER
jgi:mono/diheme cytochrome c family protein